MVGTIGFAGSEARDRGALRNWWLRLALPHITAALLGGLLFGLAVTLLGALVSGALDSREPAVAVVGLAIFSLADVMRLPAKVFARARQVPLSWKHIFPPPVSSALYGFVLATGFLSTVYYWSFYALVFAIFVVANPSVGAAAGAAFGFGRTVPVALSPLVRGGEELDQVAERMSRHLHPGAVTATFLSAAATAVAALALLEWK